ncbi:glycosyltransferase family 4 protein [Vibrio fluvialis]|nr:glycosyltransferase family 4 protein [Vibrio fluvialis]
MKALLINTSFYPQVGGVENSLRSMSEVLSSRGWSVDIVCGDEGKYLPKEKLFNANVFRYKQGSKFKFLSLLRLLKRLQLDDYNLIVSRHIHTSFALLILGVNNVKYIAPGVYKNQNAYLKRGFFDRLKYTINVAIESYVIKKCANVCVFSESMREQVNGVRSNKETFSLKPGVDAARFFPVSPVAKNSLREEFELPVGKKIILYLGRFADVKNIETLVDSFKFLPDDCLLLLVGDGPLLNQLHQKVNDLGINKKVCILGKTNKPEDFYKIADIYCLPSVYEPFGQVLLEASFSFLPIVALDSNLVGVNTATREIYNEFPSLITYSDNNSPAGFSDAIQVALSKPSIEKDFFDFINRYSWDNLIDDLLLNTNTPISDNKCDFHGKV